MKSFRMLRVAIMASIVGYTVRAQVPEIDYDILGNLRETLKKTALISDSGPILGGGEFVMAMPGIPLDTTVDLKTDAQALDAFFRVLDGLPIGDVTVAESGIRISAVYKSILDNVDIPRIDGEKEVSDEISRARETQKTYTDAYFDYAIKYLTAAGEAQLARLPSSQLPSAIIQAREMQANRARTQWSTLGFRETFESNNLALNQLMSALYGGQPWPARLATYERVSSAGGQFPVLVYPSPGSWTEESGWTRIRFSTSTLKEHSSIDKKTWSAKARYFWFASANASGGKIVEESGTEKRSIAIEMELKRVLLYRDWLDAQVILADPRTWVAKSTMPAISKGVDGNGIYQGQMPLYPTGIFLARNVKIGLDLSDSQRSALEKHISAGGGLSIGPFGGGGNYANSHNSSKSTVKVTSAGVEFAAPQILGWICAKVPPLP